MERDLGTVTPDTVCGQERGYWLDETADQFVCVTQHEIY